MKELQTPLTSSSRSALALLALVALFCQGALGQPQAISGETIHDPCSSPFCLYLGDCPANCSAAGNGASPTISNGQVARPNDNQQSMFSGWKIDDYKGGIVSPYGTSIAYDKKTDAGYYYYVVAGLEGKMNGTAHQSVREFVFSPDGSHYAYKAMKGDKWLVVVDGLEGAKYDEIYPIIFSPDGRHYAYRAGAGNESVVVVDGVQKGPHKYIVDDPVFSSDGQHVAYTINKDGASYVILDDKELEIQGGNLVFSPDGKRWAYRSVNAYAGDPVYIVLDDNVIDRGNVGRIGGLYFSPDSRKFAFDLATGDSAYSSHKIVLDGVDGKAYEFPGVGKVVFSPDGSRVAYWAYNGSKGSFLVLDGVEGKSYDEVSDPIFSPDSNHVAYIAKDQDGKFAVMDGAEGARYIDLWGLTFSADGHLAYAARDSREGEEVQMVVVDGKEGKQYVYDWIGQGIRCGPIFSPDGKYVAYVANDGGKAEFVVVNENRRLNPYILLEGSTLVFHSPDTFNYMAQNDTGTYLVRAKIPSGQANSSGCSWTGLWETSSGLMDLEQQVDAVSGVYAHDWGIVKGNLEGKNLTGKWFEAPSRTEPDDAGNFELTMAEDCQNFTGKWKYGSGEGWSGEWTGKRSN
jgi:Tol biopolymer transport system component